MDYVTLLQKYAEEKENTPYLILKDRQITYGQAYSGCFYDGKWADVSTDSGTFVRFSGRAEFQDGSSDDISFTFRVNDDGSVTAVGGTIGSQSLSIYDVNRLSIQPFELYTK